MNFKDTLMHTILSTLPRAWKNNNVYSFTLAIPYLLFILIVGGAIAIIVDTASVITGGIHE